MRAAIKGSGSTSLFVGARHIPCSVNHLLPWGKKLVKIVDALCILVQQLGFSRDRLSPFDKVENCERGAITFEQVIEMLGSRGVKRVDNAYYNNPSVAR